MTIKAQQKIKMSAAVGVTPKIVTERYAVSPPRNSTKGYRAEIGARQNPHRPRKKSQLSNGILCHHRSVWLQDGQKERGGL
jgi:hypothetical protein